MNIITTTEALDEFTRFIENTANFIAIDTEFKRKDTYYPQLCLIQIATSDCSAIIDPLAAGIDLQSFFSLMRNTKILKVFFAARQDIEAIWALNKKTITAPLFDCQVAAMFCGYEANIGFQTLVEDLLKITIDKSAQCTDWTKRPLTASQIKYALQDATILLQVFLILKAKLEERGRFTWLMEECAYLSQLETYTVNYNDLWKKIRFPYKSKRDFYLTKQLTIWREQQAVAQNLPRLWVLNDANLIDIVRKKPKNMVELQQILPRQKYNINIESIINIVKNAETIEEDDLPELPKNILAATYKKSNLLNLQKLLKYISKKENIEASLIANTKNLIKLLEGKEASCLSGWRYQIFGKYAIEELKG